MSNKITSNEWADALSMFCKKFSQYLYEDIRKKAQVVLGVRFDKTQCLTLAMEILIINLWILSKVMNSDKRSLNELNRRYIFSYAKTARTDQQKIFFLEEARKKLHERYAKYHDAWDNNSNGNQIVLAITMLECMLNKGKSDKRFVNFLLTNTMNMYIFGMMSAALSYRKDFEIID